MRREDKENYMSKTINVEIDGALISLISEAPQERIDAVKQQVDDVINLVRRKGASMNNNIIYRYSMVYLADKIIELKELLEESGKNGNVDKKGNIDDKREIQRLKEKIVEWENRVGQLQELLLEKNQKIMEMKAAR